MDYPCAKFGNFGFSRFSFIVQTDRQNHRCGADDRYTLLTRLPSASVTMVSLQNSRLFHFDILYLTCVFALITADLHRCM